MGRLTFEAFWELPEKEREERYKELSEHEKLRVRVSMDATPNQGEFIPCNSCVHRRGPLLICDAFPDGLTKEVIAKKMKSPYEECANGIYFTPQR